MERSNKVAFLIVSIFILCIFTFVGCTLGEVKLTKVEIIGPTEVTVGEFDINNYKLKVSFSDESTKEIDINEELIKSENLIQFEEIGKHELEITYEGISATLNVEVLAKDFSNVKFEDLTIPYDGEYHSLGVKNLPENTVVTYDTENEYKEIGEYEVNATIKNPNYKEITLKAKLTIEKATYDMSQVVFEDKTFEYNGKAHSILATNLPEGVSVEYVGNEKIEIGEYEIVAKFTGDSEHYNLIEDQKAKLIIEKATYDMSQVVFEDKSVEYDGKAHSILATNLPEGVSVEYVGNEKIEIGEYEIVAKFTGDDKHKPIENMVAKLFITTVDISNIKFLDKIVKYNGNEFVIEIEGELPEGVYVRYENNKHSKIGKHIAKAIFTDIDGNSVGLPILEAKLIIVEHDLEGISFNDKTFEYDGEVHSIEIEGKLPQGVFVKYENYNKILAGEYNVTARFVDVNGEIIGYPDKIAKLNILKRKSKVKFSGETDLVYNGTEQKTITATLTRILANDEVNVSLKYSGDMVEAGEYSVKVVIDNPNYELENNIINVKITRANHNIVFRQQGCEDIVYIVKDLDSLNLQEITKPKQITGYNVEWDTEDIDFTSIQNDLVIGVLKTPIKYKITYELKGGINNLNNPSEYTIESDDLLLYNPTKGGAEFAGWYIKPIFTPGFKVTYISAETTGDIVLYANWLEYRIESAPGFEIVTEPSLIIKTNVSNETENIDLNDKIIVSEGCEWKLYRDFEGNNELKLKAMSLSIGLNEAYIIVNHPEGGRFSRYLLQIYRVDIKNYKFNVDGKIYTEGTIEELSLLEAPKKNPNKTGYNFGGWAINNQKQDFPFKVLDNVEFNVIWNPINYNIKYNLNGGSLFDSKSTYTIEDYIVLKSPQKSHYTFKGWYNNPNFIGEPIKTITVGSYGDKEYFAKWAPVEYSISLIVNGGTLTGNNRILYNIETTTFEIEKPTRKGYVFSGWYKDQKFSQACNHIPTGSSGNLTLYAKWEANLNTLQFNGNGATSGEMNDMQIHSDEVVKLSANQFEKLGYKFIGWSQEPEGNIDYRNEASYTMGLEETYILYAKWGIIEYTIIYNLPEGVDNPNQTVKYTITDEDIQIQNPTREGYEFKGWTTKEEVEPNLSYTIKNGSHKDIVLDSNWTPIEYIITYELNGGENNISNPKTYNIETETFNIENPSRAGYTFIGWFNNIELTQERNSIEKGSVGELTLYAKWEANLNTLQFNGNGATTGEMNDMQIHSDETVKLSANKFEKTGYTFEGWSTVKSGKTEYLNEENYKMGLDSTYTLYAIWKVVEYTITYELNGGENNISNPKTYNIETETFNIENPSRAGYTFIGWFNNIELTQERNSIEKGSIGELTLYAKWEAKLNTLHFDGNGATSGEMEDMKIYTGEKVKLNANKFEKTGYTFEGWCIFNEVSYTDEDIFQMGTVSEFTLNAGWKPIEYKIQYNTNEGELSNNVNSFRIWDLPITLKNGEKPGWEFYGWFADQQYTDKITTIDSIGDKILYPYFIKESENLTYELINNEHYIVTGYTGTLEELTIPKIYNGKEIKGIKETAFANCTSLKKVFISEGITSIGNNAFQNCSSLISVTIPNSMTSIGDNAFQNCSSLNRILLPSNVINIGIRAFAGCSSLNIYTEVPNKLENWNTNWNSDNRPVVWNFKIFGRNNDYEYILYNDQTITITKYLGNKKRVIIPSQIENNQVIGIGANVFYNYQSLENITLPENLISIGNSAFAGCSALKNIIIPCSVTNIEYNAFNNCVNLIIYAQVKTQPDKWRENPFIRISWNPNNRPVIWNVNSISHNTDYVYAICNDNTITIVSYIGANSIIEIPSQIENIKVTSIGEQAFAECNLITSITMSSSVKTIEEDAFIECRKLKQVHIKDLTSWCNITFKTKSSNPLYYAKKLYLNQELITNLIIPKNVTNIGKYVFYSDNPIKEIFIPRNVTNIEEKAFFTNNSCIIYVEEKEVPTGWKPNWQSNGRIILNIKYVGINNEYKYAVSNDETTIIIKYIGNKNEIEIPDQIEGKRVTNISDEAFYGCNFLTGVKIPEGITSIGRYAFYICTSLRNCQLPNSIKIIEEEAFSGCTMLINIKIPEGVTSLGVRAFRECKALNNVIIPKGLTYMGGGVFEYCSSLRSVTISSGVINISDYAFANCSALDRIIIPRSVTRINKAAFENCNSLLIYAEIESMPGGWANNSFMGYWNPNNRPVIWGYEDQIDHTYTFETNGGNNLAAVTAKGIIEIPIPTKEGWDFGGWYENVECTGNPVAAHYYNKNGATLYAKWLTKEGGTIDRAKNIELSTPQTVNITTAGQKVYFKFTATETRYYTIRRNNWSGNSGDTICVLYNGNKQQLTKQDNESFSYNLTAGETYYIEVSWWNDTRTGPFDLTIS